MNIVDLVEREQRRIVSDLSHALDAQDRACAARAVRRLVVYLQAQQRVLFPALLALGCEGLRVPVRLHAQLQRRAADALERCTNPGDGEACERALMKLEQELLRCERHMQELLQQPPLSTMQQPERDVLGGEMLLVLAEHRMRAPQPFEPPRRPALWGALWRRRRAAPPVVRRQVPAAQLPVLWDMVAPPGRSVS